MKRVFPVDESDRRDLAQRLCLALRNVQVYGSEHSVSVGSLRSFYEGLVNLLDRFPEVEWSLVDGKMLLNGQPCELRTADDVLMRRMQVCELETFAFLDAVSRVALNRFVTWLATGSDPKKGQEAFVGIRIADSVYARISSSDAVGDDAGSGVASGVGSGKGREAGKGVRQFDLDTMFSDESGGLTGGDGFDAFATSQQVSSYLEQQRLAAAQRSQMVEVLRHAAGDLQVLGALHDQFVTAGGSESDWMFMCRDAGVVTADGTGGAARDKRIHQLRDEVDALRKRCAMGQVDASSVTQELDKIRGSLDGLMQTVQERADTLVEKVDADRDYVARLEREARESGEPIHLSREELLASLAEINQELAQPLTVSSALLEMLSSGRLGYVDEKQQEVVKVATDSLERLEVVVKYLQRLSGIPITLDPDQGLLSEVYDDRRKR